MTVTADLLTRLNAARATGAIPKALPGEEIESYAYRVALAGAVVGIQWQRAIIAQAQQDQADAEADNADPGTSPGHTQDTPQDVHPDLAGQGVEF